MSFNCDKIIAEVTQKLAIRTSSLSSIGAALVNSLLSRAPKQFLSTLDSVEFADVVKMSVESLEQLLNQKEDLFVESRIGRDLYYISVVMKDCPFIINTFNNILERLGIVEVVTLHPIISVKDISASVSVLVFSGIEEQTRMQLLIELKRVLPFLSRASTDFDSMTASALRQSDCFLAAGSSLWAKELSEFLKWLVNSGFIFLGAANAQLSKSANTQYDFGETLGILRFADPALQELLAEIQSDYLLFKEHEQLKVSKLTMISPIHYPRRFLHIAIKDLQSGTIFSLIGTLTSRAISEEAATMPLVRLKLEELVKVSNVELYGHDHKAIIRLINTTPKHHLLISSVESLAEELKLVQDIEFLGHSLARMDLDPAQRGVSTVVGFSSNRFYSGMRRELQTHIEESLSVVGCRSDAYLTSLNDSVVRIYFYTPLSSKKFEGLPDKSLLSHVEEALSEIALGWAGRFEEALDCEYGKQSQALYHRYQGAFLERYRALTSPEEALSDIKLCERVDEANCIRVRYDPATKLASLDDPNHSATCSLVGTLSIVKLNQQLTLGQTLPVLENMGFEVIDSETLELKLSAYNAVDNKKNPELLFLHRFFVKQGQIKLDDLNHFKEVVAPTLESILSDRFENDSLNSLLLSAKLSSRAVNALRTFYNLLWQIRKTSSRLSIRASLVHNPKVAELLWRLFEVKFDPVNNLSKDQRIQQFDGLWSEFQDLLRGVKDIIEDSTLKALGQLIICTVRTNFFHSTNHVAHKIHSEKLTLLRGARPMFETFVHGPEVEGIHLRSSRVSRGGIRWSERREDYRTEVLGLMRVQRIKNAIVVPGGAKGGFVIREMGRSLPLSRERIVSGYKEFIRSLLSIADNLLDGKVVSPKGLVIYDDPDPYLVVAADKGTASFSDYANQIAVDEYDFWLNDGFASGGSKGYGHKELGITARGAWECVKQHFIELGVNFEDASFSVVGIGDMSGDVFGNGLLLSRNMKLVAAFDHRHVFIDPNPNLASSFAERERLFALPRSSWADYKSELISKGGGIYNRLDKDIQLSAEARAVLAVPEDEIGPFNGEQIISFALKAPVDLLWNGGIGTYVKGSAEVDSEVNDSSNDAVRINGSDLRARVVGEGGNVGFTQAARVEFSLRGGRINTDSIDNSAGVDLSDHEVNLKILFQKLQSAGLCTREQRDLLFKDMSSEVATAVLSHNRSQAFVISVAERASRKSLDYFRALIRELSDKNYLTRAIDGLPSDDELEKRSVRRVGMTRPEIAVCLAGMKLWIKDEIMRSGIAKDPALVDFSIQYFPTVLQGRFKNNLLEHPLLENIAAAELTNHLVDLVGITFIHRLQLTEGVEIADAIRASIAASLVLGAGNLLEKIETLNTFARRNDFFDARLDLGRAVRVVATHFIHRFGNKLNIAECQKRYQSVVKELFSSADKALPTGAIRESFDKYCDARQKTGLSIEFSKELSFLHISWLMLDACDLARSHELSIQNAHGLLIFIWERLGLEFLVLQNQSFGAKNKWEHELMMSSYDILRSSVAKIGSALVDQGVLKDNKINFMQVQEVLERSPSYLIIETTVAEFTTNTPEVAVLHALARHMDNFRF